MKNIVTGAVSLLLIAAMGWVMFVTAPKDSGTDYSEKFESVDQRLDSLGTAMASQSSSMKKLAADVASFKSSSDGFDSGGSDESAKDESSWDDSSAVDPVKPVVIDQGWSPGSFVSSGGSSGGVSSRVVSSSFCPCGPNCNCANAAMVVSGGSNGGYSQSYSSGFSSAPTTQLFSRVRSSQPIIQRPIIQRPVIQRAVRSGNCVNGQCFLN